MSRMSARKERGAHSKMKPVTAETRVNHSLSIISILHRSVSFHMTSVLK